MAATDTAGEDAAPLPASNVEVAELVVAAVNASDPEAFLALIGENFEWVTPSAAIEPTVYRGADGVRRFFEDSRVWASLEARVEQIRDLGDRALLLGEICWRAHHRGALDVRGPLASVLYFEGGRVIGVRTFREVESALREAGVGES